MARENSAPSTPPQPMRRMQGGLFISLGVAHCLLMAFACAFFLGWLPRLHISSHQWGNMFFTFFLCLYGACAAAIVGQSLRADVFLPQAILDALAGIVPFLLIFWAVRRILARWDSFPWIALLPGLFLVWYGFRLRRGRALCPLVELD